MKVTNLFKQHSETFSKRHIDIMQRMSPRLRTHWEDFITKVHSYQLFGFSQPAVNEPEVGENAPVVNINTVADVSAPVNRNITTQPTEIVLAPEAQILFEQLQTQVGEVIHIGRWLDINQERIDAFADVTEDQQWIHTDPIRAKTESPFKTTVAHGFLTLALLPKLTDSVDSENSPFPTAKLVVNIGLNQVRFPYPVKSGNRVRTKSTLLKVTPIRKGLEIEREIRVEIEGVRRPGCVAVSVIQLHF